MNPSLGLAMGSVVALLAIIIYFVVRRVMSFSTIMDCIPGGFKSMVPAIMILVFAWSLSSMTGMLGADQYVSGVFASGAATLQSFLPAIVFLVAIFLSFSTGTSWGTFGILLPIVVGIGLPNELLIISISACLAGAVCGDHCSPISDTTIMSSTGAQCDHINHVSTQIPYAMLVAGVSAVAYVITGFVRNVWICLPLALIMMIGTLFLMKVISRKPSVELAAAAIAAGAATAEVAETVEGEAVEEAIETTETAEEVVEDTAEGEAIEETVETAEEVAEDTAEVEAVEEAAEVEAVEEAVEAVEEATEVEAVEETVEAVEEAAEVEAVEETVEAVEEAAEVEAVEETVEAVEEAIDDEAAEEAKAAAAAAAAALAALDDGE
ncbi:MAG: hypothetical protein IJP17_04410 [Clostridia bacterium]|nr:hypothetical protein [Clostridia bacterium]